MTEVPRQTWTSANDQVSKSSQVVAAVLEIGIGWLIFPTTESTSSTTVLTETAAIR